MASDSGATALIVETPDHFARFDEVRSELPDVNQVWLHANFTRSEAPASVWERVAVDKVSHRVSDVGLNYNYTATDGACTKLGKF